MTSWGVLDLAETDFKAQSKKRTKRATSRLTYPIAAFFLASGLLFPVLQVTRVGDAYLAPGQTEVRSPGQPGVLLKQFDVTTENEVEVNRRQIGSEALQQPVPKAIAYGIEANAAERMASRGSGERVFRTLHVVATAYTHTGYQTASGVWPYVGGVAVDPAVIPIGSRLYIKDYGPARAVDTGGLIKGNHIDLFFDSESECEAWGRRPVTVSIMD
jgi:3D (Asp-Asp-Asp) domain-containing protein